MECINKDEVKELLREIRREYLLNMEKDKLLGAQEAFRVVCKAPTIDAVPVVRCYECENSIAVEHGYVWCKLREPHPRDWFCADGKPKKEGNK